jgi:peptidoglycan hydrolase CwlO-like protein
LSFFVVVVVVVVLSCSINRTRTIIKKSKVEILIDKQRQEYIQAYETHMQDIQKELHVLRVKVKEIDNDAMVRALLRSKVLDKKNNGGYNILTGEAR